MGISIGFSSCMRGDCDCCNTDQGASKRSVKEAIREIAKDIIKISSDVKITNPNPDPENFTISREWFVGNFTLVLANYPNCPSFDGDKLLVFDGHHDFSNVTLLDPHFCEGGHLSPIARFKPTTRGIMLAVLLCRSEDV